MSINTEQDFEALLEVYFTETLKDHPTWANYLGIKSSEGKLEEATPKAARRD